MHTRFIVTIALCLGVGGCGARHFKRAAAAGDAQTRPTGAPRATAATPLIIGDAFTIDSAVLHEQRRVNVYTPTNYGERFTSPLPVLYMLDGGLDEDFLHIAGLVQILVSNGGMRPFMLVGIPNTQRRRDMTGPTLSEEDKKIAPVVGGSAAFRRFIREELMPSVCSRYRTTNEAAIVGESLAGLFVIETLFLEPDLFSTYIAFDPSLWWNNEELLGTAESRIAAWSAGPKTVFVASSNEPALARVAGRLAAAFDTHRAGHIDFHYARLPEELHATIHHPAALLAFRTVFPPPTVSRP